MPPKRKTRLEVPPREEKEQPTGAEAHIEKELGPRPAAPKNIDRMRTKQRAEVLERLAKAQAAYDAKAQILEHSHETRSSNEGRVAEYRRLTEERISERARLQKLRFDTSLAGRVLNPVGRALFGKKNAGPAPEMTPALRKDLAKKEVYTVLEPLQKKAAPKPLSLSTLRKMTPEARAQAVAAYTRQETEYREYEYEKARRKIMRSATVGPKLLSPAHHARAQRLETIAREKKIAKNPEKYKRPFNAFWRNILLSAFAVSGGLNIGHGVDDIMNRPKPKTEAERLADQQEQARWREQLRQEWTVHESTRVELSNNRIGDDEYSPFATLLAQEGHLRVPNKYFGLDSAAFFGDITLAQGESITVNGGDVLENLWQHKCDLEGADTLTMQPLAERVVARYREQVARGEVRRSSLGLQMAYAYGFRTDAHGERIADEAPYTQILHDSIDWNRFGEDFGLSNEGDDSDIKLLQDMIGLLTPTHGEAVFMAEVAPQMAPAKNAETEQVQLAQARINASLYDFQLHNYGEEFVNSFPSLDRTVSIGPGMATPFVLGRNHSIGIMERYFRPDAHVFQRLGIRGRDGQFKAHIAETPDTIDSLAEQRAIVGLNAFWNIAFALRTSGEVRAAFVRIREAAASDDGIVAQHAREWLAQFLATHNNPQITIDAAAQWSAHTRNMSLSEALQVPLWRYIENKNVMEYAASLDYNYRVLEGRYGGLMMEFGGVGGDGIRVSTLPETDTTLRVRQGMRNTIQ